jgi:hypothetical protein
MKPKIYLYGAIERSDNPFQWRQEIKSKLEPDYDVIVPTGLELPPDCSFLDRQKVIKYDIVLKDINDVISCQEFFVKIDPAVLKGAGTLSEITFATIYNKPITCWFDGISIQDAPGWIQGCLYDTSVVSGIKEAIGHLNGKLPHYKQLYRKHADI